MELNAVAVCTLSTDKSIIFEHFQENTTLDSFILIDCISNTTAGAGSTNFSLMRSQNTHQQYFEINREARGKLLNQKTCVFGLQVYQAAENRPLLMR